MGDRVLEERARIYEHDAGIQIYLERPLGSGTDGSVWKTSRGTAIKALARQRNYNNELECYKRFLAAGVTEIDGFAIPNLIDYSDELWIIELGIVAPPFMLDFAKVYLDRPPDFSPEVLTEEEERNLEVFEDRWPRVKSLIYAVRRYGIYYVDPKPGNIMFGDERT
jgi:hypothetical protein